MAVLSLEQRQILVQQFIQKFLSVIHELPHDLQGCCVLVFDFMDGAVVERKNLGLRDSQG